MSGRIRSERDVLRRCLPRLLQAAHAGGQAHRVAENAAAARVDQVDRAERAIGIWCLPRGLSGGEYWHDLAAGHWRSKHRCEACASRGNHRFVRLAELVAQTVHVRMVDAREPPELLKRDEGHANCGRAAKHSPAVSMTMNH